MRFAVALLSIVNALFTIDSAGAQTAAKKGEHGPRVEFYVEGRFQTLKYRVKSFRLVGANSPELAARFHGLAAQGLDSGEYDYILAPESPPPGQTTDFDLFGRVQLYLAYSYWITLQMPTGSIADGENMFPLSGRVIGAPSGGTEPLWIRFQHAVDHAQFIQAKLGGDGMFQIANSIPFHGSVIVTVCRGADVLFLDVVHFSGGRPEHPLDFRLRRSPL